MNINKFHINSRVSLYNFWLAQTITLPSEKKPWKKVLTYLVIGRPITEAKDPTQAAKEIMDDLWSLNQPLGLSCFCIDPAQDLPSARCGGFNFSRALSIFISAAWQKYT